MLSERFSKATLAAFLNRVMARCVKQHRFTQQTGTAQLDDHSGQVWKAYGEWDMCRTLMSEFDLWKLPMEEGIGCTAEFHSGRDVTPYYVEIRGAKAKVSGVHFVHLRDVCPAHDLRVKLCKVILGNSFHKKFVIIPPEHLMVAVKKCRMNKGDREFIEQHCADLPTGCHPVLIAIHV